MGNVDKSSISTNLKTGFLVYGPYASLKAGRYLLKINGKAIRLIGAYVDVVSDKRKKIYARFNLSKRSDNLLIDEFEVKLSKDVSDLEVKVGVVENDEIILHGYSIRSL